MATKPFSRTRQAQQPTLQAAADTDDLTPVRARPANENDPGIAMLLARLRRQPSYGVYYGAFAISLIWIFGWFLVHSSAVFNPPNDVPPDLPAVMRAVAVLIVPIAVFWAMAYSQWRAQQLRQVSEVLMHSALRLVRPQDIASETLTSIAQAVRQEVDLLVDGVEHAYQRATALEDIVHKEMSQVERAFGANEDRIRGLVSGLESQRAALQQTSQMIGGETAPLLNRLESDTQNLGQVINLALQTFQRLENGLKQSSDELARTIDDVSARAAMAGNEMGAHGAQLERVSSMLMGDFNSFSDRIQNYVVTLNQAAAAVGEESRKLGGEVQGMEAGIINALRQSADQLMSANNEVGNTVQRLGSMSESQMRDAVNQLAAVAQNLSQQINQSSGEIIKQMQGATTGIGDVMGNAAQTMNRDISTAVQSSLGQLQALSAGMNEALNGTAQSVAQLIKTSATSIISEMHAAGSGLRETLDTTAVNVTQQIGGSANNVISKMQAAGSGLREALDTTAQAVAQQIGGTANNILSEMQSAGSGLREALNTTAQNVTQQIGGSANSIISEMHQAGSGLREVLDSTATTITQSIAGSAGNVVAQMQNAGTGVNELLASTSGTIAAHLRETSEIVSRQMQDSGLSLAQTIENSSGMVTDRLITVSGEFVEKLGTSRDELMQLIDSSTSNIAQNLESTTSQVYVRLEQVGAHVADQMETVAIRINENIDGRAAEVTARVNEASNNLTSHLDASAAKIGGLVNSTETRLDAQLTQITEDLTSLFNDGTDRVTEQLLQSSGRIAARFDRETTTLVTRIDKASGEFTAAADTASTALDETHKKFANHVQTANTYFADQISTAATEMDVRIDSISTQLTGKLEDTSTRMSERLEDVSTLVERSVDKFNAEMEGMLANRREALDTLISDAARRSKEVDAVMTSYMNLIEESLNSAESRSREISRVVSEQANVAIGHLEDELKKMEGSASNQVAQAARTLREQHERALGTMNEMLSSTASDFQQTAQDMRLTAQQVVKEIDAARDELKRVIIDLPEETRQNADAMRKVVADQISALNALSDVVRRQTGTVDYSGPGYISPRGSGPGKSEGAPFSAPLMGTTGARSEMKERGGIEGTMAEIAASVQALSGNRTPSRSSRKAASASPEVSSNVSREVSAYGQKLHAAAREVVEAIDDRLPRDLEKRYNAGEQDVYTSRLHENRNTRVIKALAGRYTAERLLRSRINAYIRLFEKLLDTLSDVPGGAETIDAVLGSESGEVYLMLAEASGRIQDN